MTPRIGLPPDVARSVASSLAAVMTAITSPIIVRALEARSQAVVQPGVETAKFEVASIRVNREVSDRPTLLRPIPAGRAGVDEESSAGFSPPMASKRTN